MRTEIETVSVGYRATPVTAAPASSAPISLHAVNGWRGPGALAIAFAHFCVAMEFLTYDTLVPITLLVDLFFVLSGLLIAQAYTEKLSRASAIPEYIIRRFGRIWPVHAATLAALVGYETIKLVAQGFFGKQFMIPAFAAEGINFPEAIWSNLLLVHSLGFHDRETWNFPSWSLSVEFFTYVVFAVFCLARPFTRRVASVVMVVLAIATLAIAAPNHMRSTYDFGIFRCLAGFFAGTLCYDAVRTWRLPVWPLPTLVEVLAVAVLGIWLIHSVGTYMAFAAPIVLCLFIVAFLPGRGLLSRVLLTKPFQFLAELSFTIYMVHAVVIFAVLTLLHVVERWSGTQLFVGTVNTFATKTGQNTIVKVPHIHNIFVELAMISGYLVIVLLLSYATYRVIETPGRALFGALAKRLGKRFHERQVKPSLTPSATLDSVEQSP